MNNWDEISDALTEHERRFTKDSADLLQSLDDDTQWRAKLAKAQIEVKKLRELMQKAFVTLYGQNNKTYSDELAEALSKTYDDQALRDYVADEIESLRAELDQCKQDAERYRWCLKNYERAASFFEHLGPSYISNEMDKTIKQEVK